MLARSFYQQFDSHVLTWKGVRFACASSVIAAQVWAERVQKFHHSLGSELAHSPLLRERLEKVAHLASKVEKKADSDLSSVNSDFIHSIKDASCNGGPSPGTAERHGCTPHRGRGTVQA